MSESLSNTASFITELDAAVEAHLDWTRRVLRCAVLHTSPGEDVLAPIAHTLCRFGHWFASNRDHFEKLDLPNTRRLDAVHQAMHDAIRSICTDILTRQRGQHAQLKIFEQTQAELIRLLAGFKTQFLANVVRHDPLTGLPLRYGIEDEFIHIQKNCKRNGSLLYVALIDVDRFKHVNDRYGHPVGDIALRHLADTLKHIARPNEPLYRFGGEEFLLLMQCQDAGAAHIAAQRFVDATRNAPVPIPGDRILALTITMGLAPVRDDETLTSAIERADRALYEGKKAGRDRHVIADE